MTKIRLSLSVVALSSFACMYGGAASDYEPATPNPNRTSRVTPAATPSADPSPQPEAPPPPVRVDAPAEAKAMAAKRPATRAPRTAEKPKGAASNAGVLASLGYGRGAGGAATGGELGGLADGSIGSAPTKSGKKQMRRLVAPKPSMQPPRDYMAHVSADEDGMTGDFSEREVPEANAPTLTAQDNLSTFAVDVDTAAYSIARRSLNANRMPTASLVRVEEVLNYFRYDYDAPNDAPFSIQLDGAQSPVENSKHLLRVGIQARIVEDADRLPSNLVFLVDTSCSMTSGDKLALAKRSLETAVDHLGPKDKVAITTYAGGVRLVLKPTSATNKQVIKRAIRNLRTAGGTAMESGMMLAYKQAASMLAPNTNTRIVVLSDGDANIGSTSHREILKSVRGYVSEGVRLSTIGFGDGNYKDEMMEQLANDGNGNYYYIDSDRMADRVFGRDLTKMLQDVAQDVKIQVDFNPEAVTAYRLVGYENRNIADEDFRNDRVDAGEIGAGHQVTALYELTLKTNAQGELATVRVRSKQPLASRAVETAHRIDVRSVKRAFNDAPSDLRFATAVMGGAELLRHSPHADAWSFDRVISMIDDAAGASDPDRAEFARLMNVARRLSGSRNRHYSTR